ncbi:MAG: hypothetical protein WCC01_07610 [Acidimicrobiia bacterium]
MSDFATRITTLVDAEAPPIDIEELVRRLESGTDIVGTSPVRRQRRATNWAVAVGAAIVVFVMIGGFAWLIGGTGPDVIDEPTPTTAAIPSTTAPASTTDATVTIEVAGWDTVLADTRAKVPPASATCSSDNSPRVPGPSDQARPEARWVGNLAGAFDRHTGRIVYVDVTGETWTFDVCTNTWHRVEPNGTPVPAEALYDRAGEPSGALGRLVYDVDSDVTVSLGYDRVSVYDATTNTWERRAYPYPTSEMGAGPHGGVYDPVSGLIVTSFYSPDDGEVWDLWAYNVDVDEWTELGPVTVDRGPGCCTQIDLLGYSADLDRLILVTPFDRGAATFLVDPRTGEMTIIPGTSVPIVDLGWPSKVFGQANGTVYVYGGAGRALCGFDADTLSWACHNTPAEVPAKYAAFAAVTDDPINNRLTMINGVHGEWWRDATDDVWAVELSTGQWSEILAPTTP